MRTLAIIMHAMCENHGFESSDTEDGILVHVPWSRRRADGSFETGVEEVPCSNTAEVLAALGY